MDEKWEIGDDLKDPEGEVYYTSIIRLGDGKLTPKKFVFYFNPEKKDWEKYQVCVISKKLNIPSNWFSRFIKSPDNFKFRDGHKFKKAENNLEASNLYDSVIKANTHIMECCTGKSQYASGYKWKFDLKIILGELWRKDPVTNLKVSNKGRIRTSIYGHITLGSPREDGYLRTNTVRSRSELVHIICARVWIEERPKDDKGRNYEVHHENRNRSDNRSDNLRYISIDDHRRLTHKESSEESEENIYNRTYKRRKKTGRRISCKNNTTGEVLFFDSIVDAKDNLKLKSVSNISQVCSTKGNSLGYKWGYVEQEDIPGEIWKKSDIRPVEVSSHGRIRRRENHIISEFGLGSSSCYYMYSGKLVHVLIANAFHGPPPVDELGRPYQIDHDNVNKLDNRAKNLIYLSIKDHAKKTANDYRESRKFKTKKVYE